MGRDLLLLAAGTAFGNTYNLRREGYELQVSKPEVILKDIDGSAVNRLEEITIEIDATRGYN